MADLVNASMDAGVTLADIEASNAANSNPSTSSKKKEIYTYTAPWTVYTMAWRQRPEGRFQLALGSFIEEYANQFHIVQLQRDDNGDGSFLKLSQFDHPYPATKVAWAPPKFAGTSATTMDLLATSGDYLRLWTLGNKLSVSLV